MTDFSTFLATLGQFHFIRPWWLLMLLPFALLFYRRWKFDDNGLKWQKRLPEHLRRALTVGESGLKKQLPLILLATMTLLVIIICAGPTWKKEASPFGEDKTPLIIVLDSSETMLQKDLPPSRLERSKQKISDLLSMRDGGKNALITYAGSAHLAMPLTQDIEVFKPMLAAISPEVFPVQGKSAQAALPLIEKQLTDQEMPASILWITDSMTPADNQAISDFFAKRDDQLLILGAGDPNRTSEIPFDLESLKDLASDANASLTQISVDQSDLQWLLSKIAFHEQVNPKNQQPWKDMGYYLLYPVVLIYLLWFRRGWLVKWSLVLVLAQWSYLPTPVYANPITTSKSDAALAEEAATQNVELTLWDKTKQAWMDLWLTPDQQGQYYFNNEEYAKAAQHFVDPLWRGVALYYAADYKNAQTVFMLKQDKVMLFNASMALARQREYVAARGLLRKLAKDYPDDQAIAKNLAEIERIIQEANDFSASQTDGESTSFELPDDQPQTSDGADEEVSQEKMEEEKLTADDIIGDPSLADKWLERVEADPKLFMRSKFSIQYHQSQEAK